VPGTLSFPSQCLSFTYPFSRYFRAGKGHLSYMLEQTIANKLMFIVDTCALILYSCWRVADVPALMANRGVHCSTTMFNHGIIFRGTTTIILKAGRSPLDKAAPLRVHIQSGPKVTSFFCALLARQVRATFASLGFADVARAIRRESVHMSRKCYAQNSRTMCVMLPA
jgi:hypothetical protein